MATHNIVSYSYFENNGYFPCRFTGAYASKNLREEKK